MPLFRGIESMVNCGLSHRFPCVDHFKSQLLHQKERQILSQKDIVLNFIRIASVFLVVLLSTFATGVRGLTQFQNVIFVAHRKLPVCSPELPSPPHRHPSLPTPVRIERLGFLLDGYTPSTVEFLLFGFTQGFPVHFQGDRKSRTATNLMSALDNPEAVDAKLQKELESHRLAGPFQSPPLSPFWVSPLGLVPKKVQGEFRLIHHLSFPPGLSVNDGISSDHTSVNYATIDEAIQLIKNAGPACFLAKTDIKNAFRIIPIHPDDYGLLGMQWRGLYFYDRCMPMGCSSSCLTFETFSTAVEWIARNKLKIDYILHILDDYLLVAPTEQLCQQQLDLFLSLCSYLGIPIAPDKTCGPSTTMSFAGIELDSIFLEARLPHDKIEKCISLISVFLHRTKVTLKEVQSLNGLLNFACSVIRPGRAFLRRLIDLTVGVHLPNHRIRLNREVKEDLKTWLSFLLNFNGRYFFLDDLWVNSSTLNLFTDASGAHGFGAIFGSHWCYRKWPSNWEYQNIAILEFYPIVLSLYLWGEAMSNQCILFFTDNESLVHVINRQTCKDKHLMAFVQKLVSICLHHNILFKAKHIPGIHNNQADALSRLQVQTFRHLAPTHMDPLPTDIPQHLQPQNWAQ